MIHIRTFTGDSEEDCLHKINDEIEDSKIINVIPLGPKEFVGYDEYDRWTEYSMKVIYKDGRR